MTRKDRRTLSRWAALLALGAIVLPAPGCFRHHTIEPGIWRLSIEAASPESKRFARKPRDVDVSVDWGQEKGTEEIRVTYEGKTDRGSELRELKGKIRAGEVELMGFDQDWDLRIWGKVNDPQSMNGNAFGRGRINDKVLFDGTWTMVKARPEE